jgi:precorrin-2 dehydrogenase/sirohydrochlorin ferrochelatase
VSRYYPINLSLSGHEVLVVGGGEVACRKAESLVACGAHVKVVSPEFCPELTHLEGVRLIQRRFEEHDVAGMTLVFAATSDPEVNRLVARTARRRRVWVNVVDTPAECDFIVPASVTRGDLLISISTGSASPALASRLRQQLEELFPQLYADYVALLGDLRSEVLRRVASPERRRTILTRLAAEATWKLFAVRGPDAVRDLAQSLIEAPPPEVP